ncbi:MAG TPA: hypothetical protein VHY35_08325 [Stellaceae bacterium]|jgi:hypothetical protein|nr:hypothetical protein [Stellaceae bacterium]
MAQHWRYRLILTVLLAGGTPSLAAAGDLALKRVVLSTGGVGYFEYEATVDGDASLALDVPLDQVDDVLKSLMVYDSKGSAGEITLPGREPLTQSFADLPFDRAALNSEIDLLNALQGAEIRISAPKEIAGRLVHVDQETVRGTDGGNETRNSVSVMTDAGLQRFSLEAAGAITFTDPQLQHQVNAALTRIAAYRATGRRQLTLQTHGSGSRTVRVGYVVAMPLWKASYRLSLPADPKGESARLQGWAVLENFSGRAWQGVDLTLLSGNPVTFRQALYDSYYVPRPSVPVESGNRVLPPPDSGTIAGQAAAKSETPMPEGAPMHRDRAARMQAFASPAPPPAAPPMPAPIEAATAAEQETQVAFTPAYKVTVAAGQSLVLPLLDRELPARRIDLYQPSTDQQHPLAAIELTNKSDTGLPPGVLTLYQQGDNGALYLGDARLGGLPAGDKRLLSYAVDGKTTVDRSVDQRNPITKITAADGILHIKRLVRDTTTYRVKAAGPAARLLIEQAKRPGAILTAPDPKSIEMIAGAYRIPMTLAANGEGSLEVIEDQPSEETYRLLDLDDNRLGVIVSAREIDPKARQALTDMISRRQAVARQRNDLDRLKAQRAQLVDDEKRLRENVAALAGDPTLHKRMLDKFSDTETAIDTATTAMTKASDALSTAERNLATYVSGLTL